MPMLEKGAMPIAMKIPLLNSAIHTAIRKKLLDAFGGNVSIVIVGGAPMNQETEAFLMKIHFPITVGYGMTECAPLISFASDDEFKKGSVGRYLQDYLDIRIDSKDPEHVAVKSSSAASTSCKATTKTNRPPNRYSMQMAGCTRETWGRSIRTEHSISEDVRRR